MTGHWKKEEGDITSTESEPRKSGDKKLVIYGYYLSDAPLGSRVDFTCIVLVLLLRGYPVSSFPGPRFWLTSRPFPGRV